MMNIRQCVAFCILMEYGGGILGKSPDYIWEKYKLCKVLRGDDELCSMLDCFNQAKFEHWVERWGKY